MNNINTSAFVSNNEDLRLLDLFKNMVQRYQETIILPTGHAFNQAILVNQILSYLNSNFTKKNKKNKAMRFFNIMRKAKMDNMRKTHIKFSEQNLSIADKAIDYLLKSAKQEFSDDYDMEDYELKYTDSNTTFGTVVQKIIYRKGMRHIIDIVPFERFICDPVNGKQLPAGEVYQSTIAELKESGKYDEDKINDIETYFMVRDNDSYVPSKTSVRLYEIHGNMPVAGFEEGGKGMTNGMFIVLETDDGNHFLLHKSKRSTITYHIDTINEVFGRTMGVGPMEQLIEYQIITNKMGNSIISELESTRNFYQTSDTGLDGLSLDNVGHNTVINHEEGSPLSVVQSPVQGYGAKQSFLNSISNMSNESIASQDQSRGHGAKSNVSSIVQTSAQAEADGMFTFSKDIIFEKKRKKFKMKNGFLDMIMDYMISGKDIENLLTPEQQLSFRKFIAEKDAEMEQLRQDEEGALYIDDKDSLTTFFLKTNSDKRIRIEFKDKDIDRDFIRDKTYLTYGSQSDIITNNVATLERTHSIVSANPELYPSFNADSLLRDLNTSLSIANSMDHKIQILQTGEAGITPAQGLPPAAGLTQ